MKILLTGGSGFLGKNFVETYKKKYDIVAPTSTEMDLKNFEHIIKMFKETHFDAVVHMAKSSENSASMQMDNIILFKNIQYAAILYGVKKLIVIGDASDLDRSSNLVSVKEDAYGVKIPTDNYGLGRYMVNMLASKDKISTVLRFFNIYGKYGDVQNNLVMQLIARGVVGKKNLELMDKTISTIYVADAVKIIAEFVDNEFARGSYNVASSDTSLSAVATNVKKLAKKDGRETEFTFCGNARELTCNTDKLRNILPKLKFTSLSNGILKTYEHLLTHKSQAKLQKKKE